MNGNDDRELDGRDDDPVMDWALGERVGGEMPPDLVAGVRERLAAGEPAPARRLWSQLSVAALVLLGVFVVVGVAVWPRGGGKVAAPVQGAPEPKLEPVSSLADVAALPMTTRGVEAIGVDDAVLAALVRLRELEVLVVREPWNESFGLSLKMTPPPAPRHVTIAAWQSVFQLKKLRRVEFSGTSLVGRVTPAFAAEFAAGLESLPLLESLTLRFLDTSDDVLALLPKARGLRRLDLSFNHGFVEDGVVALLSCTSLRSLSLRGCQQLHDNALARLAELPELAELDVSLIDGINWRSDGRVLDDRDREVLTRAQRHADRLGMGPGTTTFAALAARGHLRSLDISGGHWRTQDLGLLRGAFFDDGADGAILNATGGQFDGSAFVRDLPKGLQRLGVCGDYRDDFCTAVAEHLTNLRHLNIAACCQITDRGLAAVAAMPSLRVLDMRQMRGLTIGSIDALLAATQLEEIDLRHIDFVTAEHVVQLRRSLPNLKKLETSVAPADIEAAEKLPWSFPRVANKEQIERMLPVVPKTYRALEGIGLDDQCMAALARLEGLEGLVLRPGQMTIGQVFEKGRLSGRVSPITDEGFQQLLQIPTLRTLHLDRLRQVTPAGLAGLAQLPLLRELSFDTMAIDDATLVKLACLPLHTLRFDNCRGFGRIGVDAITQMLDLRDLAFAGCVHMEETWLERLAALPRLERVDLSHIGSRTYFSGLSEFGDHVEPGSGVTDRVLEALGKLKNLRELSLAYGAVDAAGLRGLHAATSLQSLDLFGTTVHPADLEALPPTLTRLVLGNCRELGQDFGPALAKATPQLTTLVLAQSDALRDDCLKSLQAVRSLRSLDLSDCGKFTAGAVDDLAALTWLEELKLYHWSSFGTAEWAKVRAMPNLKILETEKIRVTPRR